MFSRVLSPEEFRETGLMFEVNRWLLHPYGLTLAVTENSSGSTALEVLDAREDGEGVVFAEGDIEAGYKEFLRFVDKEKGRLESRRLALGYVIQPVDSSAENFCSNPDGTAVVGPKE